MANIPTKDHLLQPLSKLKVTNYFVRIDKIKSNHLAIKRKED
jgi:hypothetical protein